jgi:TolA-binding protein
MSLKSMGRSMEKRVLRPVFRRLKRWLRVPGAHDRIARLEQRVEQLESLFREQAGLHYLRLADEADADHQVEEAAHRRRTA